ncbi:hypothetical protein [Marinobacter apostichopi]|uniref:hypothetical protein n=1 Tax=Marinobacter apostichopi TaxID=3035454 RepID=UPI002574258E|nr:hypothetical protein [Marinobacter sp. LA51]
MADVNVNDTYDGNYYGVATYRPDMLPLQKDQHDELNRSKLSRSASLRLPWGSTRDVVPPSLFSSSSPKKLRKLEKREDMAKKIGLQSENDHECLRHAHMALRTRFFDMMNVLGKLWFYLVTPISLLAFLMLSPLVRSTGESWVAFVQGTTEIELVLFFGGPILWLVSDLAFRLFPRWLLKAGRGPEWEFNRRTGMVKVWQYPRKLPLMPRKPPDVIEHPFYEFDAWCCARVDRHGSLFDLVLSHRYSKLDVTVGDILGSHGHPNMCYAYWDFIQNYMDVTRPLPDFPLLEKYRDMDPVTAEHDREAGRPERYWRDMDMDTFKKKVDRMHTDVTIIDTVSRPNLMEERVRYAT